MSGLPSTRPRVVVLFGGQSSEHSISCVTAGSVLAAIDRTAYDVIPVGITRDGRWVLERADPASLVLTDPDRLPEVDSEAPEVLKRNTGSTTHLYAIERGGTFSDLGAIDVVFPLLHGPWGEDGAIQGLLESANLRYVGAGVLASAVGMDKHYMKVVFDAAGLPGVGYEVITDRAWTSDPEACRAAVDELGYPVFVKPCRGGSSIGITRVTTPEGLDAAVEEARRWDPKVLVEQSAGEGARELECGVVESLDGAGPECSVVAEITVEGHDFYDFEAKYLPGQATRLDVPALIEPPVADEVRRLAALAFEALSVEGLARVDCFLLPDGRLVVNEINTMPGFTPTSMFPRMWAAAGVAYPDLVDRLLRLALARPLGLR